MHFGDAAKRLGAEYSSSTVRVPRSFNAETMYPFIDRALALQRDPRSTGRVFFDFGDLAFIEPAGVVAIANLIEYLRLQGTAVLFMAHHWESLAIRYLDDSGFFERYDTRVFPNSALRSTTMPLQMIDGQRSTEYLNMKLIPWIGRAVDQSPISLDPLRTSLEEIFHNFRDHSGVNAGCTFAQHFPNDQLIRIAIADFGEGIPTVVRRDVPTADDTQSLSLACQEGFTTGKNGHNRGAGLPNLIRYVTRRIEGTILLAAGAATLAAKGENVRARAARGTFPGTMVQVIIPTGALRRVAADVVIEDFEW